MFILHLIIAGLFIALPALLVRRLARQPVGGDIQTQLLWRGSAAGLAGGSIGAASSTLLFGAGFLAPVAFLYGLIVTAISGMFMAFAIGGVQKAGARLGPAARVACGCVLGAVAALVWVGYSAGPANWLRKGFICMMMATGVVSGILSGPLSEEGRD